MAATSSVRAKILRQLVAQHEAASKREHALANTSRTTALKMAHFSKSKRHAERAKELRIELARYAGSTAPREDVAASNRARRIEHLRAAIERNRIMARQARGVGNRSVEGAKLAEAKRLQDELDLLERRDVRIVQKAPAPPKTLVRPAPPSKLDPARRKRVKAIDTEIDQAQRNAAAYRDRARRYAANGDTVRAAKASEKAQIMEARVASLMAARRRAIYKQGKSIDRGERRVDGGNVPETPGPGDVPLITQAATPTVGGRFAARRPGFIPPRADTHVRSTEEQTAADKEDADATPTADDGADDASTTGDKAADETPEGGGTRWWLLGGILVLGALGFAAFRSKKGGTALAGHHSFSMPKPPNSTHPKPNPRKKRRSNRHRRGHRRVA